MDNTERKSQPPSGDTPPNDNVDKTLSMPPLTGHVSDTIQLQTESEVGVRLMEGHTPDLHEKTAKVLQERIWAVASVLSVGLFMFLVRGFFLGDALMQGIRVVVLAVTLACVWVTRGTTTIPLPRLRIVEGLVFGGVCLQVVLFQITQTAEGAFTSDNKTIVTATMFSFITWIFVVLMYGMFIPNSWKQALRLVGPASLVPIAMALILEWRYHVVVSSVGIAGLVAASIMSLIAGLGSLAGSHVVHSLRKEAFEARQYGQYQLTKRLGAGGMGEVWLAEHRMLKRPSALKLIQPGKGQDPLLLRSFELEVQATATLTHGSTVEIFDYGRTEDGIFYYVMEYLPGLDLYELVQRHGRMPPARVAHFLVQICGALEEAHGIGLIHRDIKPANVIASCRGGVYDVAKLVDFGLVRQIDMKPNEQRTLGSVVGSPLFMSPEHIYDPHNVDGRSDLYCLGATAYYLLTATFAFPEEDVTRIIQAHISTPVPPPSTHVEVPQDLEAIILKCMEKDPDDRFQTAAEMRDALRKCECLGDWSESDARKWWKLRENSVVGFP